jgi:DNA polymerase sigma
MMPTMSQEQIDEIQIEIADLIEQLNLKDEEIERKDALIAKLLLEQRG